MISCFKKVGRWSLAFVSASILLLCTVFLAKSAITSTSGLAVAQDAQSIIWNNVRDGAAGDNLSFGVMASQLYFFDGTNFDRARGTVADGLLVDVGNRVGTAFFAVKRSNITTSSVNLAFGFTSEKVLIETPSTNDQEICIDWLGATAVCPSANTAGDDRIRPGSQVVLDDFRGTSISVIADSGTQEIFVRAFE